MKSKCFLKFASKVCVIAVALAFLPWANVLAEEEDPRIKNIMDIVSDKPKETANPKLRAKLKIEPDKPQAQDFTLTDLHGNTYTLSELRGKKLFVHFWSIYCPKCTREVSTLEQMYELYYALKEKGMIKEVKFLGINFGESKDKIIKWAKANNVSLEPDPDVILLLDEGKKITKKWKVRGLPSTYLIDKEGHIVATALGERDWTTPALLNQIGLMPELGLLPE